MRQVLHIWEWLGDEKNLKRTALVLPLALGLFGGVFGFAYWMYGFYFAEAAEEKIVVDSQGNTATSKEVNLRYALMLKDLGSLRMEDGDFEGAERSFDDALSLIDKDDASQEFHLRYIMYQKVVLYREMDKGELYDKSLAEYDALFSE